MATTHRSFPFIYVTWMTKLLSGDDACQWAGWFKAHFKHEKVERDFDLSAWKADHADMVTARRLELEADGWTVTIEDQNSFKLKGETALLSGKPDIVARRDRDVLVVDCKSGAQRDSDFFQVLVYLFALPLFWAKQWPERTADGPLCWSGEVDYLTHRRTVAGEELTGRQIERLVGMVRALAGVIGPARVPSARECAFCDISKSDCPDRVEAEAEAVQVACF